MYKLYTNIQAGLASLLLMLMVCSAGISQTNTCNNNAGGNIPIANSCVTVFFDITHNNDFWDAATGCGASDVDATWGYFTAVTNSTTITYNPDATLSPGVNPVITIFSAACATNMTALNCVNAGGIDVTETIVFPTVVGTQYRIRVENQGSNADMYGDLCVFNTVPLPPATNVTCTQPNPICSGSPIAFIANAGGTTAHATNPGNQYGCLTSTPNPSWYYMEIDQSGVLAIDITAGSDVDFRLWGPFANLAAAQAGCNSYTNAQAVDCSFSISATEQANANVLAGQVYVLLVTNYANTVQTISINEAGSNTASTNCAIVPLPVGFSFWDLSIVNDDVVLMWETESEHNNSHFLVQRSQDGILWETIGAVQGSGDSEDANAYSFRDNDPISGVGYYRLSQVDLDGKSTLTSILAANTLKSTTLKVFPNPSHGLFTIQVDPKDVSEIYMTDIVGKMHNPEITDGGESLIVNTDNMAKGIYNITAVVKGEKIVQRIIVQ